MLSEGGWSMKFTVILIKEYLYRPMSSIGARIRVECRFCRSKKTLHPRKIHKMDYHIAFWNHQTLNFDCMNASDLYFDYFPYEIMNGIELSIISKLKEERWNKEVYFVNKFLFKLLVNIWKAQKERIFEWKITKLFFLFSLSHSVGFLLIRFVVGVLIKS